MIVVSGSKPAGYPAHIRQIHRLVCVFCGQLIQYRLGNYSIVFSILAAVTIAVGNYY